MLYADILMNKKRIEEDLVAVAFSLFFMFFMYFFVNPSLTGFVVYDPTYSYNASEINLTNGISIKAIANTTTVTITTKYELALTSAAIIESDGDFEDVLNRVATLDNLSKNVDKSEIFNVTFNGSLSNLDKITFKAEDITGSSVAVYLCDASANCSYPGYGAVNVTGAGVYFITISGLNNSKNSFNIDPEKVNFNHINATHIETITNTTTSYYYPTYPIEIVTEDIQPANLSSFDLFLRNDSVNGQNLTYKYSIDSGTNWSDMPEDNNLSSVNSTKIKIKAIVQSDGSATPYVYSLSINYTEIITTNQQNNTNYTENNQTNSTQSNQTNSTQNNSTESNQTTSNSTNSTGSGSGGATSQTSSPSPSGGVDSGERSRKLASAQAARSTPSAPAAPSPATAAPSSAARITGSTTSPPTGNIVKEEKPEAKIESKIVANTIIWSILLLVIVIGIYVGRQMYLKRKALKGQNQKHSNGIRIRAR